MTVCADLGRVTAKTGSFSDHWGVPKCSPSRVRRRERRTAERDTVAAAEKVAAEKAAAKADSVKVAEKNAEKASAVEVNAVKVSAEKVSAEEVAADRVAADKVAAEKTAAENVVAEKFAAKKVAAEKVAAEKVAAEKVAAENISTKKVSAEKIAAEKESSEKRAAEKYAAEASTSCHGTMSADLQHADPKSPVYVVEEQPPPLPLCHYCCHRGSGKDPVHYFLQCVCPDWPCTCWCYCTDAQIEHKKLVYPAGFGLPGYKVKTVSPEDRQEARAIAEARTGKARPCDNPSCMREFEEDNARALGQL